MRHLCWCFDKDPHLRPPPTPLTREFDTANYGHTSLSAAQVAQITEIFNLFDTDGTGCIEQREIGFALSALGFQTGTDGRSQQELDALDAIMGDGKVTLEEFSALMTGDIGGHVLYEEARTAFAVLSRSDGDSMNDGLITLSKLEAVCLEFRVQLHFQFLLPLPSSPQSCFNPSFTFLYISHASLFQLLLSTEDLQMMMDEVSGGHGSSSMSLEVEGSPTGRGTVDLKTYLQIIEKSSW